VAEALFDTPREGVGLITLNRPEAMNAMSVELMQLFGDFLADCERRRDIRCVAVTGAGRGFCAGGDVKGFAARASGGGEGGSDGERPSPASSLEAGVRGLRRDQNRVSLKLHTMGKPSVALVNGAAAGAGMSVALACDIRFCSDRARFVPAFGKVALSGDYGGSYLMQRLIGYGRARELYFNGDPVDAQRALELGIANHVVPHDELMDRGLEFCERIARGPTAVYARMKENFTFGESSTLAEALDREAMNMRISGLGRDHREGSLAFVEKRDPRFTGD
jgi:2-(1,2-epoxy-1,2-dihydrophenyl)acetyl-CoA isomerase